MEYLPQFNLLINVTKNSLCVIFRQIYTEVCQSCCRHYQETLTKIETDNYNILYVKHFGFFHIYNSKYILLIETFTGVPVFK